MKKIKYGICSLSVCRSHDCFFKFLKSQGSGYRICTYWFRNKEEKKFSKVHEQLTLTEMFLRLDSTLRIVNVRLKFGNPQIQKVFSNIGNSEILCAWSVVEIITVVLTAITNTSIAQIKKIAQARNLFFWLIAFVLLIKIVQNCYWKKRNKYRFFDFQKQFTFWNFHVNDKCVFLIRHRHHTVCFIINTNDFTTQKHFIKYQSIM